MIYKVLKVKNFNSEKKTWYYGKTIKWAWYIKHFCKSMNFLTLNNLKKQMNEKIFIHNDLLQTYEYKKNPRNE